MHNQGLPATFDPQNHRNAILAFTQSGGRKAMSEFDWESSVAYERAQNAEITGFAWECLRRNPDFRRDHRTMVPARRGLGVTAEFRRKWGVCFRG